MGRQGSAKGQRFNRGHHPSTFPIFLRMSGTLIFGKLSRSRDASSLVKKLDSIWFGSFKLKANIPRFNRVEVSSENHKSVKLGAVEKWPRLEGKAGGVASCTGVKSRF
ncbi:hypothetical protein RIF29_10941 [Crotalaria pallida]|uniref:Uncharacterized protein n=1 Tax=Crotalaria pallida TaxID=3830 RepID=A0AAN9FTD3_CROPI